MLELSKKNTLREFNDIVLIIDSRLDNWESSATVARFSVDPHSEVLEMLKEYYGKKGFSVYYINSLLNVDWSKAI